MRITAILISLFVFVTSPLTAQEDCTQVTEYCSDTSPVIVEGVVIEGVCKERVLMYSCSNEGAHDYCEGLKAETIRCVETDNTCIGERHGECIEREREYTCTNADPDYPGAQLLSRNPRNIQDDITGDCDALSNDANCQQLSSVCAGGVETREINYIDISRDCWNWEQKFQCSIGDEVNTCEEFESDPACREIRSECLVESGGDCTHYDVTFECGGSEGEPPAECTSQTVCVGGVCAEYEDEPSDDFLNAQAWLKFLDEASRDRDAGTDTIFTGLPVYCRIKGLGYKNCCSGSGWGLGLNLASCRENEQVLKAAREAERTVYIGTICVEKVFGYCISKRRMYCQFNSKFGRIAQEQIRDQLDRDFGSYSIPNCNGLTVETLESIDMEELDFSEAFPDIAEGTNTPEDAEYQRRILERLNLQ